MSFDIAGHIVVNALGALDNPNAGASEAASTALIQTSDQLTIDARALADAHASGVTAINVTLGYTMGDFPPYEHTLREIETWDAIIRAHHEDLTLVGTAEDIARPSGWTSAATRRPGSRRSSAGTSAPTRRRSGEIDSDQRAVASRVVSRTSRHTLWQLPGAAGAGFSPLRIGAVRRRRPVGAR